MKKLFLILAVILCLIALSASTYPTRTVRQQQMHEIANLARSAGLPEDSVIIQEAQRLWAEDAGREEDMRMLARLMYNEAGNGCVEEHIMLVGRVALNRVAGERFPDTLYDVLVQPNQYHVGYTTHSEKYAVPAERLAEFEDYARRLFSGELSDTPENVIFQDNNRHGTGVYKSFYSEQLGFRRGSPDRQEPCKFYEGYGVTFSEEAHS